MRLEIVDPSLKNRNCREPQDPLAVLLMYLQIQWLSACSKSNENSYPCTLLKQDSF